jgi:hypothetical protein
MKLIGIKINCNNINFITLSIYYIKKLTKIDLNNNHIII